MLLVCLIWFDAIHRVSSMLMLIVGSNLGRRIARVPVSIAWPCGPMRGISPLAQLKGHIVPFSAVIITVSRPTPSLEPPTTETLPPIEMASVGVVHVLRPISVPCPCIIVMGELPICICLVRREPWRFTRTKIRGPYVISPVTIWFGGYKEGG